MSYEITTAGNHYCGFNGDIQKKHAQDTKKKKDKTFVEFQIWQFHFKN